jgi:hypothetical protein
MLTTVLAPRYGAGTPIHAHPAMQVYYDTYNPHYGHAANLDSDNDGRACEDLP